MNITLKLHLSNISFPTTKDDILKQIKKAGASEGLIESSYIGNIPNRTYLTVNDVIGAVNIVQDSILFEDESLEDCEIETQLNQVEEEITNIVSAMIPELDMNQIIGLYSLLAEGNYNHDLVIKYYQLSKEFLVALKPNDM